MLDASKAESNPNMLEREDLREQGPLPIIVDRVTFESMKSMPAPGTALELSDEDEKEAENMYISVPLKSAIKLDDDDEEF